MALPDMCRCGSRVKPGQPLMVYLTEELMKGLLGATDWLKWKPIITLLELLPIGAEELCASGPPEPPVWGINDFLSPTAAAIKLTQTIRGLQWKTLCECQDCPPTVGCVGDNPSFTLNHSAGYWVAGPDYFECKQIGNFSVYMAKWGCLANLGSYRLRWYLSTGPGDPGSAQFDEWLVGGATYTQSIEAFGEEFTIYANGAYGQTYLEPPPIPGGVIDVPGIPTCDPTTICAALSVVYDKLDRVERHTNILRELVNTVLTTAAGSGGTYEFDLPGLSAPISGQLVDALPRALAALRLPPWADLTVPDVVELPASGDVAVAGYRLVSIELSGVPAYIGSRGDNAEVYYSNHRAPGPGWVQVVSADGVHRQFELVYPEGLVIGLEAPDQSLRFELHSGVAVTVRRYKQVG